MLAFSSISPQRNAINSEARRQAVMMSRASRSPKRPLLRRAAVIIRSISSAIRYSEFRLVSFGWRTGGCFWRFAQNDVWGNWITAAFLFASYRVEPSYFAQNGHCGQCSIGDPESDDLPNTKLRRFRGDVVAYRPGGQDCLHYRQKKTFCRVLCSSKARSGLSRWNASAMDAPLTCLV